MKNKNFIEVAGWVGIVLILSAYALISFGALESGSNLYQAMNALGACGIVLSSVSKKDYPPVVLNLVWLIIALIALVR